MAKFVEWANSLLGRFEEQVDASTYDDCYKFSKFSIFPRCRKKNQ